ncbi:MAG TPA: kelch repeat-containing protein [Candidatus Chromulinivoraceae bacterium]|nr:kelch repeat-containing protein [Candidatus Chromulinivoraceae bacterium]
MARSSGLGGSPLSSSLFARRRTKMRTIPLTKQVAWSDFDNTEQVVLNDWVFGNSLITVPRGQYADDQSTPISIGAATSDGISTNVWLESDVYTGLPTSTRAMLAIEDDLTGTAFSNIANTSTQSRYLKEAVLPTSRRGGALIYDVKNQRFILFGGYDGTLRYNEVWELSATSAYHRWKLLKPTGAPPAARNLCASTYVRGTTSGSVDKAYMIVWGGALPADSNEMFSLDVSTPGGEAWTTITQTGAPSARDYITHHMAAKTTASNTNDIYLFGGWAANRASDLSRCTFDVNAPTAVTWTTLKADGASGNPSKRSGAAMIYDPVNDRLIITSGYDGTTYLSDVWQYSISGNTFTQLTPTGTTPAGRELPSVGYDSVNHRLILMAGWQGSTGNDRNDILQLSLMVGSESWTQIKSNDINNQGMFAFSNGSAAVDTVRNIMVITTLNGFDSTDKYVYAFNMNDTSASATIYSLTIEDYMRARDAPAYVFNSSSQELLLINGYSAMDDDTTITRGEHVSEVWAYDRTNNKWRWALQGPFGIPQCEGGLAIYDSANDRVIFFGGLRGTSQVSNDVWQLKADIHGMYKATKLSPSGTLPPQRWLMAGCYDAANHRMIIWSGQNTSTILGDVWALDLTLGSETWTQLAPTGTAPTAVWQSCYAYDSTNSRLYVHGGFTGAGYSSQLFYLNTSTTNCAWVNTNVSGGLAVRGAVMGYDSTNQRLVCFGGYDGTVVNNTVRYASTSTFSSWVTQTTNNAPDGRRSAGCGIVGNYLIVTAGRPVSGAWFSDTQELDLSVIPTSWSWTSKYPSIYQVLAIALTGLSLGSYHWQAWASNGISLSPYQSFGGNGEGAADFIVGSSTAGLLKTYSGSTWVAKAVKVWNGSAWVVKPAKYWDGSAWQLTTSGAGMATTVVLDAIGPSSSGVAVTGTNTLSWSHTCSGSNRYLVAAVAVSSASTTWTTTATCNGTVMTSLGRQQSDNQNDGYVEMFGIIPPVGSCAIVVTSSNTVTNGFTGGSISATGVDQVNPVRTTALAYGIGTTIQSSSVAGASHDLFIDAACCGSSISTSTQTLRILQNHDNVSGAGNIAMSTAAGATSVVMGYSCSSDWWGIIGIALRAVGT